jgi:hypothetical protein
VVKQQIAACAVFSWEKGPECSDVGASGDMQGGERFQQELADFSRAVTEGVSPGQMFRPPKGMKLNVYSPNVPGEQYFPHMRLRVPPRASKPWQDLSLSLAESPSQLTIPC